MLKNKFNRMTIMSACSLWTRSAGHSEANRILIEFDLEQRVSGNNLQDKANELAKVAIQDSDYKVQTLDGELPIGEAIIRMAVSIAPALRTGNDWEKFIRGLHRDGFVIEEQEQKTGWLRSQLEVKYELRKMYPVETAGLDVSTAESEVISALKRNGFNLPCLHLEKAVNQHSVGNWSEANGEIRKALEDFLDQIAFKINPKLDQALPSNTKRETLLDGDKPFLFSSLNELTKGGSKPSFIQGLMNRLHAEGGHAGLSSDEDSTFRLHIVIITMRLLLKRFEQRT